MKRVGIVFIILGVLVFIFNGPQTFGQIENEMQALRWAIGRGPALILAGLGLVWWSRRRSSKLIS